MPTFQDLLTCKVYLQSQYKINRNFHMHLNKQARNESITNTVTSQVEILADRLQSTFSPEGACMKLASKAFTFCSLTTLCKQILPVITTAHMYSKKQIYELCINSKLVGVSYIIINIHSTLLFRLARAQMGKSQLI